MYDDLPSWYSIIYPIYYISGKLLSILAPAVFIWLITIKVFKIRKEKYHYLVNIANLVFCILSTVLLVAYFLEFVMAWRAGYGFDQFAFVNRALGPNWFLYILMMWIPLLLTQFFWRKKNRMNINLALFIVFMFNLHMWFERIYILVISLLRD